MPDVADYKVISDGGVNIKTGCDIDHTFNFDLGTEVKHDQSVVLQSFYVSSSNANNRPNAAYRPRVATSWRTNRTRRAGVGTGVSAHAVPAGGEDGRG